MQQAFHNFIAGFESSVPSLMHGPVLWFVVFMGLTYLVKCYRMFYVAPLKARPYVLHIRMTSDKGFMPKPTIISPSNGTNHNSAIEKFLMMYTCKICSGRNAQMV